MDAPGTVASFLQRLGRTGRRPGTTRNCLFLTTSDDAFLRAAGILDLWSRGYVEPIEPPPLPYPLFAQQVMALALQTGGVRREEWREWIGALPCFAAMTDEPDAILTHMLETGILHEDQGRVWFGAAGEKKFGYKNFLELYSIFTSPPLFTVLHGRTELGLVHESSFLPREGEPVTLLLGGRSWMVRSLDWGHHRAFVEAAPAGGRSRWCGAWVDDESTAVVRGSDCEPRWWTFAGLRANAALAVVLGDLVATPQVRDNLTLPLRAGVDGDAVRRRLEEAGVADVPVSVPPQALTDLKFVECLPVPLATRLFACRARDAAALAAVGSEGVRDVSSGC